MPTVDFPLLSESIHIETDQHGTTIRLPLQPHEQLFGFGLQFQKINQRNSVLHLHMDHYGGRDNGRTHAPIPFYVSSNGYGVWINTASYVSVYAGSANRKNNPNAPEAKDRTTDRSWTAQPISDAVEIFVPDTSLEILIFGGPTPLHAVRRYNLYCGGGCLPPRWGLGFWHRVPTPYTDQQVETEIDDFEQRDFPLHVIGLEPGWHSKAYPCTYEWSPDRFPSPKSFVEKLTQRNIHINLWENPYVSPDASIYNALEPLSGSHTVWCGLVPDYTLLEAQKILATQHETEHFNIGISGYKIDECDGYDRWLWPDHAKFPSGKSGIEIRQTYGLQLQSLTTGIYRKHNKRTFGLVRGTSAGGQSLPYVLYSDYYNHRDYITALCNSGISGLLWCPEVRSASSSEDWIRRIQTACFSPLTQLNAWASGTKPWSFPEVENAVQNAIQWRLRLTPY
ncbi:MAG: glycoside hydrolase family 31 protein, partial [Candidatus Latescibacteria bacterium]|nr:glycoside hydrolase family 31 protein [Candidatus Latescibacterota bacterium]